MTMRCGLILAAILSAGAAGACDAPVCIVDPETLGLTRIITFEEARSTRGPGHLIQNLLVMPGAVFGERFAGQSVSAAGFHDRIDGEALSPLTLMPGASGQNLAVVYFDGNNVLNGYGVAGYPKRDGQGEGAISFLFDEDQSALAFQLRGGEEGAAQVMFLSRDSRVIAVLDLPPAGEHAYGFLRASGVSDIAGIVVTNTDPQGLALDNVRFGKIPDMS